MLRVRRHARIVEHLRQNDAASLQEMASAAGVSVSTIRRDVDHLCDTGLLERTHGGAILSGKTGFEMDSAISNAVAEPAKAEIGRDAAAMILPGQMVLFDSGSTCAAAAIAVLARDVPFTAVTNDLRIAGMLGQAPQIAVHVLEGQIRPGSNTLWGARTIRCLEALRLDVAFLGTHALDATSVSESSAELAEVKRTMIARARRAVLLADSSKMFSQAFCRFGTPAGFETVLTDPGLGVDHLEDLVAHGVNVVLAGRHE